MSYQNFQADPQDQFSSGQVRTGFFSFCVPEKNLWLRPWMWRIKVLFLRMSSFPIEAQNKLASKKEQKMFKVQIDSTCFTFIDQKKTEYGNYQVCMKKFHTFYWFTIYIFTLYDLLFKKRSSRALIMHACHC